MNAFERHAFRYLLAATAFIVLLGTVVYHFVEHFSWVDAYYFCIITLATVGYGDLAPHTEFGVKGIGEGGAIAPPAVLANAVEDALAERGAVVRRTPLTPESVRTLAGLQRVAVPEIVRR